VGHDLVHHQLFSNYGHHLTMMMVGKAGSMVYRLTDVLRRDYFLPLEGALFEFLHILADS